MQSERVKKVQRRRNRMSQSDAVYAATTARRLIKPVIVTGVHLAKAVTIIQPKDFARLNVDERYQRVRITTEVNSIVTAIKSGGQVAAPIDVAERPDGTWWIVDGQQRFWAHAETETPIRSHIHKVDNLEAETNLFLTLNARMKVQARVMIKGWPGVTGDLVRRLAVDDKSPVAGLIDLGQRSDLPLDAVTVVKSILTVTTGVIPNGDMSTRILPRTDVALALPGAIVWAEDFMRLVAAVFDMNKGAGRARVLPVMALARVAHRKYLQAGRPIFPKTTSYLRRVNWDTIVPTHAGRYLPVLEQEIEKRWKE